MADRLFKQFVEFHLCSSIHWNIVSIDDACDVGSLHFIENYAIYINVGLSASIVGPMKSVRKKYAIKSNVPWLVLTHFQEIPININVCTHFEYRHCCGLFIVSIHYSFILKCMFWMK